ncbi:glycosyltransferase [Flavobacterium cerinum]|uniref:Glycosyltransferase family 1 protein n=1 Tax=Flavobacterium cerinum TaxID=2502784 RepID=A0A3S4STG9_9FLAO|nr:glycosyltransferase [Flavobacterium cerinum]RWW92088.1 glycosyltransferase family 1 protein [Flavobacterium cerinum]
MRILLIGEYSRLHNSLKEGLLALGHEVILISDGDGFKQYPSDFLITPKTLSKGFLNIPRQIIFRIFKYDIAQLERGMRFYKLLPKLKNYDVVQLINEAPIKTSKPFEKYLLNKIIKQNKKTFLLCCGMDYTVVKYMADKKPRYSIMDPFFKDISLIKEYRIMFEYISKGHKKLHDFLYSKITGVIASDMDYYVPLLGNSKFMGLIPNPINISKLEYNEPVINGPIIIFMGINRWIYNQKGIPYFEKALTIVKAKYQEKIEIVIAESLPYNDYIKLYSKAHILLDQVYAYDQGYNALEAMAKGKVVFTGAEKEFMEHYNLIERVAINALPDVDYLVNELSLLIENPDEIIAISKRTRAFIEKEHEHIVVAKKYIEKWSK